MTLCDFDFLDFNIVIYLFLSFAISDLSGLG